MPTSGTALIDPAIVFKKIGLSAGMRVADFGCGRTGHFVFPMSPIIGDKGVIYAVDIMKDILESIKSRSRSEGFSNIQAVWSDLESVGAAPIPEGSLDAGFFVNVMFLLKNRLGAIKESLRLIREDGYLIVIDWAKKVGPIGPTPEQMVNQEALVGMGLKENLQLVGRMPMGDYHFCVIFKKKKEI
ncbi:MAG: methyltransferase domain-containing protein [Candidatus Magasanikbacteria bacterium]|nr:methyltransferase domain-containing protein [Candidatus Magasanikbacteria bacterium]